MAVAGDEVVELVAAAEDWTAEVVNRAPDVVDVLADVSTLGEEVLVAVVTVVVPVVVVEVLSVPPPPALLRVCTQVDTAITSSPVLDGASVIVQT